MIFYAKTSQLSGILNFMLLPCEREEIEEFEKINIKSVRVLVEQFFPHFNEEQKEFILTGTTKEEWNKLEI